MIAKMNKGRGFRGALDYVMSKDGAERIGGNMSGQTPRELAAEFGTVRHLRPGLNRAVFHASLSAAPGEQLSDEQWREISREYLQKMGFTDNQFVVVRHRDSLHDHVHIIANRITFSGDVVSDSHDFRRQESALREIEFAHGLQRVQSSEQSLRRAPTRGEIEYAVRTGEPSTKIQLQQLCDAAAKDCHDFTTYVSRLEAAGVEVIPTVQKEGTKLSGLLYRLDGVTMKGSDLGKGYTAAGIQKRGISYEQDRDFETVRRCLQRSADRVFGDQDSGCPRSEAAERRAACGDDRTLGPGDDGIVSRDEHSGERVQSGIGESKELSEQYSGVTQENNGNYIASTEAGNGRTATIPGRPVPGADVGTLENVRSSAIDRGRYSGSYDRIISLSIPAESAAASCRYMGGDWQNTRQRTAQAAKEQIAALGVERVEIGVRDAKTGKMQSRVLDAEELEKYVPWLKRENAMGRDVYVRPAQDSGVVLLDDIKRDTLERMRRDGVQPAAVLETSPGNYQAWVKVADKPLPPDVRKEVAQDLASRYNADIASADAKHYGRLAGFTNRKPQYERNGLSPFVLVHEHSGCIASAAPDLLRSAEARVKAHNIEEAKKILQSGKNARTDDPVEQFKRYARNILSKYPDPDLSRLDFMVGRQMAIDGYSGPEIQRAIAEASPNIEERKKGHLEDYAQRTVAAVERDPGVRTARAEQARSRDYGLEL